MEFLDVWMPPLWVLLGCGLAISFISSMEMALNGLSAPHIRSAVDTRVPGSLRLLYWIEHPDKVITSFQFYRISLIVVGGLAGVWASQALIGFRIFEWDIDPLIFGCTVGVFFFLLCHIAPRAGAKKHAFAWAVATMPWARTLVFLATPIVVPLMRLFRFLTVDHEGAAYSWTPEELNEMIADLRTESLGERSEDLISSIIEFSDTVIREIMVPRTEMIAIPSSSAPDDVRRTILEAGHSRIPVYDETVDNIVGLLHVKDLFKAVFSSGVSAQEEAFEISALLRSTFYVPEVMKISELLREFQRRKTHMAIVVDEYGGTAGVVTLEDIIEEIVGEIQDEYDVEEKQFRTLGDGKIIADGRVSVWDLEEVLSVRFPEDSGFETLAGFLMFHVGYLPKKGSVVDWKELKFTIKDADDKHIATVEIDRSRGGDARLAAPIA